MSWPKPFSNGFTLYYTDITSFNLSITFTTLSHVIFVGSSGKIMERESKDLAAMKLLSVWCQKKEQQVRGSTLFLQQGRWAQAKVWHMRWGPTHFPSFYSHGWSASSCFLAERPGKSLMNGGWRLREKCNVGSVVQDTGGGLVGPEPLVEWDQSQELSSCLDKSMLAPLTQQSSLETQNIKIGTGWGEGVVPSSECGVTTAWVGMAGNTELCDILQVGQGPRDTFVALEDRPWVRAVS